MSGSHGHAAHGHAEHAHRPTWQYAAIAVFLGIITAVELGPLFDLFRIPPLALLALSAIKFFTVVAFFMHLWDDPPVFTRLFAAPLIGASLMVVVLMILHGTFAPSPEKDPFAVQERYAAVWNQECSSWLRSNASNRWYCASPPIDAARVLRESKVIQQGDAAGPTVDLASMSEADRTAWLMKRGEEVYAGCAACHQANGQGIAGVFPPLAGSDYAGFLDKKEHIRIILKGLQKEIVVNGVTYNGAMPAQNLPDIDVAAVATYERLSWGNNHGAVSLEDVAAAK